jgi:hypothetical protein
VGDLAAAGGMANVNCVLQVEMRRQRRQIIGIVIHVVTIAHLRGPAMTSAVMSYDAMAVFEEKQHLRVPVIGGQRPAMAEHDGLTFAPVLVKDLDAVFGRNCTHRYLRSLEISFTPSALQYASGAFKHADIVAQLWFAAANVHYFFNLVSRFRDVGMKQPKLRTPQLVSSFQKLSTPSRYSVSGNHLVAIT